MNSYIIFTVLVATTSAHYQSKTYSAPASVNYAKSAELYQSGLELKQNGGVGQSQGFGNVEQTYHSEASQADKSAKVLRHQHENNGHGYQYIYETDNGIKAQETGTVQGKSLSVQGEYSYTGHDGQTYTVTYTADENGFHPSGAHLPTPPPTPEAILKSLEYNAQQEANGVFDDGTYKESQSEEQVHPQHESSYEQYQSQQMDTPQYHQPSGFQHLVGNQIQAPAYHSPSSGYEAQAAIYQAQPSYQTQSPSYQTQSPSYQTQSPIYQSQEQTYQSGNGYGQAAMAHVSTLGTSGYQYRQ